ncbi:LOW QUALITY PROTEIN: protocadherin Fat 4-like [Ptychodera flava]|uniref:LOW QUALITY PROTEIN: protocadherin Fat 4-like n=1 Tax=Ptychodera flava TaxID=63121 RepID=UPI00396A0228
MTTTGPIDYELEQSFSLTVTAEDLDGAPGANSATTLVTVTIEPVNEAAPVFQSTPYDVDVSEDVPLATSVFQVVATDADDAGHPHGQIRYSITAGNGAAHFTIDEISGEIFTVALLDRETIARYVLTIAATDSPTLPGDELVTEENVTITVTDVNDNVPVFTPSAYSASIDETEPIGTVVVTLTTYDADSGTNGQVDITKTAGDPNDDFILFGNDLQVNKALDHSVKDFYQITYTVTDRGTPSLSSEGYVTITILSVNRFPPVFDPSSDSVTWSEYTNIGQLIYTAVATDDDGPGKHSELAYFITDGDPGATFLIDRLSGEITLSALLDRETIARYLLEITAYDNAGDLLAPDTMSDTMNLTVIVSDENDNSPIFNPDQYFENIDENVPIGFYITTVTATDRDSGTNGAIQYSFAAGLGQENFNIDPNTGVITTADDIDYETDTMFSLMVEAVDGGTPQRTGLANVQIDVNDLNDNAPVVSPSDFTVSISEDAAAFTLVTPVLVYDADSGTNGEVTCSIVPDTDPLGQFLSDPIDCDIFTTNVGLDRETRDKYDLIINATDGGTPMLYGLGYITVIILDVNDNAPIINPSSYAESIYEDTPVGTVVLQVLATDADIGENARLTYTLTNGNELGHFNIDPDTGVLTVAQALDRETKASYAMTVTVNDNGTPMLSSTAPIDITLLDVNDNTPTFTMNPYVFGVEENVPLNTFVDAVTATDPDAGLNGEIVYSLESGANKDHFYINPTTGRIYTAAFIDRENIARYDLVCKLPTRKPSLYSETDVIINVIDVNDNTPVFTENPYEAEIDENSPIGTEVVTVTAIDLDEGSNGAVTYTIPASETVANTYFQVGSTSGIITVKQPPDYETHQLIDFVLLGADNGSPSRTGTTTVSVTINDLNDNYPIFNPSYYSEELSYLNDLGEPVVTVTATDADFGQTVTYYFKQPSDLFELDTVTGNIRVIVDRQPDRDTKYDLFVEARDNGVPRLTSQVDATIRIDTFNPYDRLVEFYMSVSMDYFLSTQDEFIAALSAVIQEDYPTGRAGVSHILRREIGSGVSATSRRLLQQDHEITVYVYGVQDNTADSMNGFDKVKKFTTNDYLFNKFTANSAGTPSDQLVRDPFTQWDIKQVLLHEDPNKTPWYQTWGVSCYYPTVFVDTFPDSTRHLSHLVFLLQEEEE